jgi:hypothetical protein
VLRFLNDAAHERFYAILEPPPPCPVSRGRGLGSPPLRETVDFLRRCDFLSFEERIEVR